MKPSRRGKPHVLYRLFDEAGELLYIGITLCLDQRLAQHANTKSWWPDVATVTQEEAPSYLSDAMHVERVAIATERPRYNVRDMAPEVPEPTPDGQALFASYIGYRKRRRMRCTICGLSGPVAGRWMDSCRIKHGHLDDLRSPVSVQP